MGGRKEEKTTGRRVTGLGKVMGSSFSIYAELLVNNRKYTLEPNPHPRLAQTDPQFHNLLPQPPRC